MTTAAQALAVFRSMIPAWKYEEAVHNFAGKVTDCQGAVDWVMLQLGQADKLGPELPWNVSYMIDHSTLPGVGPLNTPHPGDILVLGDPRSTDPRCLYAHTGMATETPGHYISNYAEGINVAERPIDNLPIMQLVRILRTGFDQPDLRYQVQKGDKLRTIVGRLCIHGVVDERAVWQYNNVPVGRMPTYSLTKLKPDPDGHRYVIIPASLRRTS